jgi:hypothetical protein
VQLVSTSLASWKTVGWIPRSATPLQFLFSITVVSCCVSDADAVIWQQWRRILGPLWLGRRDNGEYVYVRCYNIRTTTDGVFSTVYSPLQPEAIWTIGCIILVHITNNRLHHTGAHNKQYTVSFTGGFCGGLYSPCILTFSFIHTTDRKLTHGMPEERSV